MTSGSPGPSIITRPTPGSGLAVRRPVCKVMIDGRELFPWFEVTMTRGLDQPMATCEITVPHPLPDWVKLWSRVQIIAGAGPAGDTKTWGAQVRFTGYINTFSTQLWPPAKILHCQDVLWIAANSYWPEEVSFLYETDGHAVESILATIGYDDHVYHPGVDSTTGTDQKLDDIEEAPLSWELGESALEAIQKIDAISLGWRTFATAGGHIVRRLIDTTPLAETSYWEFKEGVDILDGTMDEEIIDPKQEITQTGWDGTTTVSTDPNDDPFAWWKNTYWIRFEWLKQHYHHPGEVLIPQERLEWILSQINQRLIRVSFSTFLDMPFAGQEVIKLVSPTLEVEQQFWVQNVSIQIGVDGSWTQTLAGVSRVEHQNRHIVQPPITTNPNDPGTDAPVSTTTLTPIPTGPANFLPDFTIEAIDKEDAANPTDGASIGAAHYVVTCSDTSANTQINAFNRTWAASGPGCTITSSGSGPLVGLTFTTAFTSLAGAQITLTLTDGLGHSASVTKGIDGLMPPIRSRKLYSYTATTYEAWDGGQWRSTAPVLPSAVTQVGNGPFWGAGPYVAITGDDLATAPVEILLGVGDVTALWMHEGNNLLIAAGTTAGEIFISKDGGQTWTAKTSPSGESISQIIISIFRETELHVVTPSGWFTSDDQGTSWRSVRAGSFAYLELSHTRNIVVTTDGVLQVAESGTPFTGPTSPIKTATAHIRADAFYAICEDGTCWYQEAGGSLAMVQGSSLPDGAVLPGGAFRDPAVVDMIYVAAGDGGIFKSLDGFRTDAGWLRLRTPGRLTP